MSQFINYDKAAEIGGLRVKRLLESPVLTDNLIEEIFTVAKGAFSFAGKFQLEQLEKCYWMLGQQWYHLMEAITDSILAETLSESSEEYEEAIDYLTQAQLGYAVLFEAYINTRDVITGGYCVCGKKEDFGIVYDRLKKPIAMCELCTNELRKSSTANNFKFVDLERPKGEGNEF